MEPLVTLKFTHSNIRPKQQWQFATFTFYIVVQTGNKYVQKCITSIHPVKFL